MNDTSNVSGRVDGGGEDPGIGELDDHVMDVSPELGVVESLRNALQSIQEDAEAIGGMQTGEVQVEAAERLAQDAGELDEQIGSIARSDAAPS